MLVSQEAAIVGEHRPSGGRESELKSTLFDLCEACQYEWSAMSCIPPSAFHAKDIREAAKKCSGDETSFKQRFNDIGKVLNPVQYNGKMMNSVWGLYNRYSSHNVKTNCDCPAPPQQAAVAAGQPCAAAAKLDTVVNVPSKVDWNTLWSSLNFSQSH